MVRDCDWGALRQALLSGFPTIATSSLSRCPISGPSPFVVAHHRRPRHIPLPRDDIPHTLLVSQVQYLRLARM